MRLDPLTPEQLDDSQREVYDAILGGPRGAGGSASFVDEAGRLQGPFNAMLYNPPLGLALQELGAAIRYRGALSGRARELVILVVAAEARSEYEWQAHVRIGRNVGLEADEIEAVRSGAPPALSDPQEMAALELARLLVEQGDLDDDPYAQAVAALGESLVVEVVTLVGYYALVALQLRVFRVPLPEGTQPAFGLA